MVKDHSDSERGNPMPPHRLLFPINSKGSFICTIPQPLLHWLSSLTFQGRITLCGGGGLGGRGEGQNIDMPISTEGSGMPTGSQV